MKIPERETLTVEFKSDVKKYSDEDLVEEIVGMANTEGGFLYLGVEDDGSITGLHEKHRNIIGVEALLANKTLPHLAVRAQIAEVGNHYVMAIEVPKSRAIVATSSGKVLRRRLKADGEPENIPLYPFEMATRLSDMGLLDFSAQPVQDANLADFDVVEIARLRNIIRERNGDKTLLSLTDEELEQALRLVVNVRGTWIPTLTGLLILGREERLRELVPTWRVDFQVLKGTKILLNESYHCPFLRAVENVETNMKAWNSEQEIDEGLYRVPIPDFAWQSFREGFINALAHRDYSMLGSVRVLMNEEGLTINNPGGLLEGITLENLLTVPPQGRNPCLSDVLKRIGLAERTGRGVDRIFDGSIAFGRPWPDYTASTSAAVVLFLPRAQADASFMRLLREGKRILGRELSLNQRLVLSALQLEGKLDKRDLLAKTHMGESRLRVVLQELEESELVMCNGSYWELNGNIYRQRNKHEDTRALPEKHVQTAQERILDLAKRQGGSITKQDVVSLLDISQNQAYNLLKKLQKDGKITLVTSGKYAKYQLVEDNAT